MIYEGANGIQALDLVGRKLAQNGGRALRAFLEMVDGTIAEAMSDERLSAHAEALASAKDELQSATMWLMQNAMANPDHAGAGSTAYLRLMALVAFGYLWLVMARAANHALDEGADDKTFYTAKLLTARHFFDRQLPDAGALAAKVRAGAGTLMAFPDDAF
jgi:hypothetical protein